MDQNTFNRFINLINLKIKFEESIQIESLAYLHIYLNFLAGPILNEIKFSLSNNFIQ